MKKILYALFILGFTFIYFGCSQEEILEAPANFKTETKSLRDLNSSLLKNLTSNATDLLNDSGTKVDQAKIFEKSQDYIDKTYDIKIDLLNQKSSLINSKVEVDKTIKFGDLFEPESSLLLEMFYDQLLANPDPMKAKKLAEDYYSRLMNNDLIDYEERIRAADLIIGVLTISEYFSDKRNLQKLQKELKNNRIQTSFSNLSIGRLFETATAQSEGSICPFNWTEVWHSAVWGFFSGAAGGCYAGATVGTVIFPGGLTVGGCVGVGVVSAALGFTTGALGSIGQQLVFHCLF